ncbi:stage II sporulation protein E [Ferroacidibacillus organovorans]|uniref:PPM-type phosphatase domain-containing protein n=1 Tax=Ferroacidibacillus organovorans TaxID=1765683 RepID=A0A853KF01_9BACL|nr:stage II sporulation protein E [Ferroacidibacillus organovorans]KYP81949.1 hypothetical protein AYJ22_05365 [Ferroacidibacillus organovorans]OAG94924.1 hypothetical protein AYW79_02720 [Ferroacidibacillus organovorans]
MNPNRMSIKTKRRGTHIHLVRASSQSEAAPEPAVKKQQSPRAKQVSMNVWQRLLLMLGVLVVGVLFGRAVIVGSLTPFPVAAFAVALQMRRGTALWLATGLLIGSVTHMSAGTQPLMLASMLISFAIIQRVMKMTKSFDASSLPFIAAAVDFGFRIGFSAPLNGLNTYTVAFSMVDALLCGLLAYMFMQLPQTIQWNRSTERTLGMEEWVGILIILASCLTGLHGIAIGRVHLEPLVAGFLVLSLASVGGAGIGAASGVICGLIIALGGGQSGADVAYLGFAGLLAGVFRDTSRYVMGIGYWIASSALAVDLLGMRGAEGAMFAAAGATLLFLLTPKRMLHQLARYVPGTTHFHNRQLDQARRIKDLMTSRMDEIAHVFQDLSSTFHETSSEPPGLDPENVTLRTIDTVHFDLCSHCRRQRDCFELKWPETHKAMAQTLAGIATNPRMTVAEMPDVMARMCIKNDQLLTTMKQARHMTALEHAVQVRIADARSLVASQLDGVASMMKGFSQQLQRENGDSVRQEKQIIDALSSIGYQVQGIEIMSLEEGQVEIQILEQHPTGHDECAKLVAPLLSDLLRETIAVRKTEASRDGSYQVVTLGSARKYDVIAGCASASKNGALHSGDSYTTVDLGTGRFAIALSDGMGNGERAHRESNAAVRMVQQLLRAGFDETTAVKTVNSALALRSQEEIYATLDLAIIDLYTLQTEFLKVGSVATFVKQGRAVRSLTGNSVPIGILNEIDVQTITVRLAEGSFLTFMSDGVLDAVSHMKDPEEWVRFQLERLDYSDPQVIADLLLESAVRAAGGVIRDDMTVVCARIGPHRPQWATIPIPEVPKLRNPRRKRVPTHPANAERLVKL